MRYMRERELKRNKNRIAVIRSAETTIVPIGPNQPVSVKGYLDKELEYNTTCAIIKKLPSPHFQIILMSRPQ